MSDQEKTIQRLQENIRTLKLEVAASKLLQKKIDRSEQERDKSMDKFKTVFEQSPLGHKFIDADLRIIKVNKALIKLLGYKTKELLGSRITDIAVPEFASNWKKLQQELWTNQKPFFTIDTCLIKKNKSIIWCHITTILLEDNGKTLGYSILEDISGRKTMEHDLKKANERERQFEQQLLEMTINIQEKERARIAEDLHNSLGQLLYGVKLNLNDFKLDHSEFESQNVLTIKNIGNLLSECIQECRRISHDLMPSVLQDYGLRMAIEDICKQLSKTIDFTCEFSGPNDRLPKYMEKAIYRIVQELAMNLIKHADATKAYIKLGINEKNIVVRVEDNGKGFYTSNIIENDGIGIQSIKTKLHLLKGELDIDSAPGKGTIINIRVPSSYQGYINF
jgi:PAS domain S-box-containing protein